MYQQAEPSYVSYRQSADNGKTCKGCGVYGSQEWQGEAPDITVSASGKVMMVSHEGELYTLNQNTFTFSHTRLITCSNRDMPSFSAGDNDLVFVSAFEGVYNSMKNGNPGLEQKLNSITGKPIGFVDNVVNGTKMWLIFEEGDSVSNEEPEGTSAIFIVELNG